jgi:hypothetical protein
MATGRPATADTSPRHSRDGQLQKYLQAQGRGPGSEEMRSRETKTADDPVLRVPKTLRDLPKFYCKPFNICNLQLLAVLLI